VNCPIIALCVLLHSLNAQPYIFAVVNCSDVALMNVGRGEGGDKPLDFEIFSKKTLFLVLSGKKQI